jgi:predicted lipoprotein with Yx(FWY)xxD motif
MQWTYDGKPVYFFKGDAAKGDVTGDGKGGVWHVINE